jgi:hypothetical protein
MASSWKSQRSWSEFTDSASNNSAHIHYSWAPQSHPILSDFEELDSGIPPLPASLIAAPIQDQIQPIQDSPWSPCPSCTPSSWSPCPSWATSSWSPCPSWSLSQGSTDGHFSHLEGDGDYSPPHNSMLVTSSSRSILDENAPQTQNQTSQNIGMSSVANAT